MRVAILKREVRTRPACGRELVRLLECGHEQIQKPGGNASKALFAHCGEPHPAAMPKSKERGQRP